jgi:hypothetical protein
VSKDVLRWRTALILRELEEEIRAFEAIRFGEEQLRMLMSEKEDLEAEACAIRLTLQRQRSSHHEASSSGANSNGLARRLSDIRVALDALDEKISPLAKRAGEIVNPIWGPLMRAGNDKSHLARQVENYADIYTSRVSNLMFATPFAFLRSRRGSLPHDPTSPGGQADATTKADPVT